MRRCAVIMAGGSGTRLWPLSRRDRPKQLLNIIEGRSLIRHAYERLRDLVPAEDIHVIALAEHIPAISRELPELPPENLLGEPMARDTAAAIALAAAVLGERDPQTIMGVFTADHLIRPVERFVEIVRRGYELAGAESDALVTFGIKPTEPHTGLGYIRRGAAVGGGAWSVGAFKEKPDLETARRFVASGDYYWNSGMFVWRTEAILGALEEFLPDTAKTARELASTWGQMDLWGAATRRYELLERISIDHAVMEKAPRVLVVEMDLEWLDVGSWTALPSVLGVDAEGNTVAASNVALMDAHGNIIVSEDHHLIAAIGVEDLVIVRSSNATLICKRDQVQRIKELLADLERRHKGRYS